MEFNVETAVRICPLPFNNSDLVCVQPNTVNNTIQLLSNAQAQCYPVNYALPADCCQNTVFTSAVTPLVNYMVEGCDVSIVTLGQSGTGKSYTLLGPGFHCASSESEHGIIPRFVREIFTKIQQYRDRQWSVQITWSQICGENVQDLLGGVGSVECSTISDVFQLIQLGMSNIAPKCVHTLFTLTLEQQWVVETTVQHKVSTASFADLAGTERILTYDSLHGTMQTIPKDLGLQTLERCIITLSDTPGIQNNCNFIPYTQSVLTTLLKDSFGGRAKTLLICCVSPLRRDITETLYTLQLALRAQTIRNFVTVNSYTTFDSSHENLDIFGLQFAANQLLKLVSNAEELFQRLVSNGTLPKNEQEQISQWLTLKQECEDCLSENSEPHRSLERIEEEEIEDSSNSSDESVEEAFVDKIHLLMDEFSKKTNLIISKTSTTDCTKESVTNSSNEYHLKGARGRRGSIHSAAELNPVIEVVFSKIEECPSPDKNSVTPLTYDAKRKSLKQVLTSLHLHQQEISDLEKTIKVKENLMQILHKYKYTKLNAQQKIEEKLQNLQKQHRSLRGKVVQAQLQQSHNLEKYRNELVALELKLRDAEFMKNITEDGGTNVLELESSIYTSKRHLEKLKKYRCEEEKQKKIYEKQLKEDKIKLLSNSETSFESCDKQKTIALISRSDTFSNLSVNSEDLECLRREIRNLRKTRDHLLEQTCKINHKSQNKKILNDMDQRKLIQHEEAIEVIDLTIDYKNAIICGHQPLCQRFEDSGDMMLMERLLKLTDNEMRILLHQYFEKVVNLRSSTKKLEMQMLDIDNQNELLIDRNAHLRYTLQRVRLEGERRIAVLQQQYEENLHKIMKHLAGVLGDGTKVLGSKHVQLTGITKLIDRNNFITKIAQYGRQAVTPAAPPATVIINGNKIIMQQDKRS